MARRYSASQAALICCGYQGRGTALPTMHLRRGLVAQSPRAPNGFSQREALSNASAYSCRGPHPDVPAQQRFAMPCTAAARPGTVVTHSVLDRATAAVRMSQPSTREPTPNGVFTIQRDLAVLNARHNRRLAVRPLLGRRTRAVVALAHHRGMRTPLRRSTSAVPAVASTSKPRSASRFTGKIAERLSRLAIETNTVPLTGSEP